MAFKFAVLTPTSAIDRLTNNDPTLTICDLSKSAVMQMNGGELIPKLAAALEKNTVCQELLLGDCGISDQNVATLAAALTKNTSLVHLNLEGNKVGNDGATALAKALASNRSVLLLNLFGQKGGTKFGDTTLHAFCDMLMSNVTLLKITWRLDSRQSFRLNKLLVRNNDINKRIKDGKDYADLLPEGASPLTPALIAQREAAMHIVGGGAGASPRISAITGITDRSSSADGGSARMSSASFSRTSSADAENEPPSWMAKKPAAPTQTLEEAMAALDAEYEKKAAELKASFDKRREIIKAQYASEAVGLS